METENGEIEPVELSIMPSELVSRLLENLFKY